MSKILLGSMSPGRKHILDKYGFTFDAFSPDIDEKSIKGTISFQEAIDLVLFNSKLKMDKVLEKNNINIYSVIITSDTTVFCNNKIYEKTYDKNMAKILLSELIGKTHKVITGVSLCINNSTTNDSNKSIIQLYDITDVHITSNKSLIDFYLQSDDCLGKAGCYGVQGSGALIIEEIIGSLDNVIGLPMNKIILNIHDNHLLNLLKT